MSNLTDIEQEELYHLRRLVKILQPIIESMFMVCYDEQISLSDRHIHPKFTAHDYKEVVEYILKKKE